MRAFVLNFSALLNQTQVHSVLNASAAVETWATPFPFSAIVVSRLTVLELGAVLHSHFGEALFILVEATKFNTGGWLPIEFWNVINDPQGACSKKVFSLPALGVDVKTTR